MALTVDCPLAIPLLIGIWMEADDNGIFEWKPLTLKARILPATQVDIGSLLLELECRKFIKRYAVGGREYGAVRNFKRYQRPKKPNSIHPITPLIEAYIGTGDDTTSDSSEPVPHQAETPSPKSPQMEEEGGRREDEGEKKEEPTPASPGRPSAEHAFVGAVIKLTALDFTKWKQSYSAIEDLTAELTALDDWIRSQPEAERKRWFHVVSGALKKRHIAATLAAKPGPRKVVGLDF